MSPLSAKTLSLFLKSNAPASASIVDRLKICYRPYICPFAELLNYIDEDEKVFDIGCGSGQFLLLVAEFFNPKLIGGVEVSKTLLENSRKLLSQYKPRVNIELYLYNGTDLPDQIKNYNIITLIDVFHHLPVNQRNVFLGKLHEKMSPGATLILKDIDASNPLVFGNKVHDYLLSGERSKEISMYEMQITLNNAGFALIESVKKTTLWYPHFWFICKKN